MAMFKSGNPALNENVFKEIRITDASDAMTARGTMNKLGLMLLFMMAGAFYTWSGFSKGQNVQGFMLLGAIGGFIIALVMSFKRQWASYLAPAYAILEGLFLGAVSAYYNYIFKDRMPNIVTNAVGLTMGTAVAMFLLYNFRIIRATERFKSIVLTATAGIAIFYLIVMVLRMFGVSELHFMHDSSPLGIGISLFVVAIAALNLIMDFDMIEQGAAQGAPKYMEWYGAFGLMVTLVWLYLEILRLLSRFANNK
jgi:uncharacterized YccA/Bax inhibitor family protein